MQPGHLCHFTKLDGSILDAWLPLEQVALLSDPTHPFRMQLFERLGAVSVEVGVAANHATESSHHETVPAHGIRLAS